MTQYLGLNISDEIAAAIAQRIIDAGSTKTEIVTAALEKDLGIKKALNLADKVEGLDFRLTKLEAKLDAN